MHLKLFYLFLITTKEGTHIKDVIDLKHMFMVIVALIPCVLFGMWNVGYQYIQ